jgi:8-amino-3,8-dideoxy-alpha-D-manno-octulosonate transaminase
MRQAGLADVAGVMWLVTEVSRRLQRRRLRARQARGRLFSSISIETFGHCNRACTFCFVNHERFPARDDGVMDEQVWTKIIDELATVRFAGRISPYFYGEPLLDKRLDRLLAYARARCPYATIHINTNGDFLTPERVRALVRAGVDGFHVTDYELESQPRLRELASAFPYWISLRHGLDPKNRAGMMLQIHNTRADDPCPRPSEQIVINWKGQVVLCCCDSYARHVFGNARERSVLGIWYGDELEATRQVLARPGGRRKSDMCRGCDL